MLGTWFYLLVVRHRIRGFCRSRTLYGCTLPAAPLSAARTLGAILVQGDSVFSYYLLLRLQTVTMVKEKAGLGTVLGWKAASPARNGGGAMQPLCISLPSCDVRAPAFLLLYRQLRLGDGHPSSLLSLGLA